MRRSPFFLLFALFGAVLVGCKAGRRAAVSNDGLVASTTEGGTFVAGRGRVAAGGEDLVWSPSGGALAIATKEGVVLWPGGRRLPGLSGPLAFAPSGDRIAGTQGQGVRIRDVATGASRATTLAASPTKLRWTSDGRLFSVDASGVAFDGGPRLKLNAGSAIDAVATTDGDIWILAWEKTPHDFAQALNAFLRIGTWNPTSGTLDYVPVVPLESTLGAPSPRRILVPLTFALAPQGRFVAASVLRIESEPQSIGRLRALAAKTALTPSEEKEAGALLKAARTACAVVRSDSSGRTDTLWTGLTSGDEFAPTDLAFSSDGKWLAIARRDGTVRVPTGE